MTQDPLVFTHLNCYEDPAYWEALWETIQEWERAEVENPSTHLESNPDPAQYSFSFYPK